MKPKLSQPTGVCCYCVLSKSRCNSTCPLFFPPFVFYSVEYFFSFHLLATFYFSFVLFSIFSTSSHPTNPRFHSHVVSCFPKRFTYLQGKSNNIPLVGFECVCVFIQSCCGILKPFHGLFSNFCGALAAQNLLSWERGTQSPPMHMEGASRVKRKAVLFPQSISRDQMRPYIWAQLSTAHWGLPVRPFPLKTSKRNPASKRKRRVPFIMHLACGLSN